MPTSFVRRFVLRLCSLRYRRLFSSFLQRVLGENTPGAAIETQPFEAGQYAGAEARGFDAPLGVRVLTLDHIARVSGVALEGETEGKRGLLLPRRRGEAR